MSHLFIKQIALVMLYVFDSLKRTSSEEWFVWESDYHGYGEFLIHKKESAHNVSFDHALIMLYVLDLL